MPQFFDLLKLPYGDSIVVSVHGFLGTNETINVQNPARSERQLNFNALPQDGVKIPDAKNLTKAVQDAQIGWVTYLGRCVDQPPMPHAASIKPWYRVAESFCSAAPISASLIPPLVSAEGRAGGPS